MSNRKQVEALREQVADKVRNLRKKASDPNVPECDRKKARSKLAKYRDLLLEQTAEALNGGTKTKLREA